jgi:hypothetical protein
MTRSTTKARKAGRKAALAAGKGIGRGIGKGLGWSGAKLGNALATPFDKAKRDAFLIKRAERAHNRRRWVGLDGTNKPSRQPAIKHLVRGGWHCKPCGVGSNDLRDRAQHKCDSAKIAKKDDGGALGAEARKTRARAKKVRHTHGTGDKGKPASQPRPTGTTTANRSKPASTTGGARIVRSNTAAERFAYLAQANPESAHQFEQLMNDLIVGHLRLSQELTDLAERLDLDKRVVDGVIRCAEMDTEPIEALRSARTVFRVLYAPYLDGSDVKMPKNATKFFEQKTA